MEFLPPPGPERRRQLIRLSFLLVLLAGVLWYWSGPAVPPARTSNQAGAGTPVPAGQLPVPEALALNALRASSELEDAGRNPFVYGERAAAPHAVLDLGCNTGDYAAVALDSGAGYVIGAEADAFTAHLAFERARKEGLNFLPLVQDAANPSPSQGWRQEERESFWERARCDFLVALAVEHHLAIGRNIPLDELLRWMVGLAPRGVIEFVQKSDPTVRRMLSLREDIFADYTEENFRNLLAANARVVEAARVSEEGRILFLYERPDGRPR